jgi:ABC-2 type transport system ATP-binding protein
VLILDEPTAGLDPTQILETRQLIRELGRQHTILLSTHILSEVEMACDQVIIIHKGKVAASGSIADLSQGAGSTTVVNADLEGQVDLEPLQKSEFLSKVETEPMADGMRLRITTDRPEDVVQRLCAMSVVHGWRMKEIRPERQTLEDLFIRITRTEETPA